MLSLRPCTVVLKDGRRIACDHITKTSICIVGLHSGYIDVAAGGREGTICLDDVQEIIQ